MEVVVGAKSYLPNAVSDLSYAELRVFGELYQPRMVGILVSWKWESKAFRIPYTSSSEISVLAAHNPLR